MRFMPMFIVLFLLAGCCTSDHPLVAKKLQPLTNAVLPEYEAYVKADPKLNELESGITPELKAQRLRTKQSMLQNAAELRDAVEKLKKD